MQNGENPANAVHLIPEKETGVHLLSPAFLQLSPHHTWLASVGRDGLLRICEISEMVFTFKSASSPMFLSAGLGTTCFSETDKITV